MTVTVVAIEFRQIQRYLFGVPRLRDMIGANVLLGELIRTGLPGIVRKHDSGAHSVDRQPTAPPFDDPLERAVELSDAHGDALLADRPIELYAAGILARDGGHFRAVFENKDYAELFIARAGRLIADMVPGVGYDVRTGALGDKRLVAKVGSSGDGAAIAALPHFEICRDTGADVAVAARPDRVVGHRAVVQRDAGTRFLGRQSQTHDIIGLLRPVLPGREMPAADELAKLADEGGYIALIEADGNRVGERRRAWAMSRESDGETANETFFWHMRVAFRAALLAALADVFTDVTLARHSLRPYQLLMLGGDDVLLITQPQYALELTQAFAAHLQQFEVPWRGDETKALTIAAGVVIARHSFPFHALQGMAGALTTSAKRIARLQMPDDDGLVERSTVDWMVTTASGVDSPVTYRRSHDVRRYRCNGTKEHVAYSAKPYPILAEPGGARLSTLAGHLEARSALRALDANDADRAAVARSQLRQLALAVRAGGRRAAESCFADLSPSLRNALKEAADIEQVFDAIEGREDHFVTRLLDLIELNEIDRLGRQFGAESAA